MKGLNGEPVLTVKDCTVGWCDGEPYGYKQACPVTVSVSMERLTRRDEYETVSHKRVRRPLDFSITTAVWRPNRSDMIEGGATVEPLRQVTRYADGWDAAKVAALADLAPWHLNAMSAGCEHQTPVYEQGRYGRQVSLDRTPACPVTGYRYGSAWLVRELPAGFLDRVRALFPASALKAGR